MSKLTIYSDKGPLEVEAAPVFRHVAQTPNGIIHIKTGLLVARRIDPELAKYLDKAVRWTWLNQQPFGPVADGRGKTMAKKAIVAAIEMYCTGHATA